MPLAPVAVPIPFEQILVGEIFRSSESFGGPEMDLFAALSRDRSAIHADPEVARHFGFPDRIQYGFLLTTLLSRIVGENFDHAVCAAVSVDFTKPVMVGERIEVRAQVSHVQEAMRSVALRITMLRGDDIVIRGKLTIVFLSEPSL